jgi:hypothetical protein
MYADDSRESLTDSYKEHLESHWGF